MAFADTALSANTIIDRAVASFDGAAPVSASPTKALWRRLAQRRGQVLRVGIGASLLAAAATIYAPDMLYTTSSEAVLNARTITIATPIDGRVAGAVPAEGTEIAAGQRLMTVENPVVDRSRLEALEADRTRAQAELNGEKQLITSLNDAMSGLAAQLTDYRHSTTERLSFAAKEAQTSLDAAEASVTEAQATLARKQSLVPQGIVSKVDLDQAQKNAAHATAEAERARLAVKRIGEERDAADRGVFIAENNNGAPYAQQRIDELKLRLAEALSQTAGLSARLTQLDGQVAAEAVRVDHLALSTLHAPAAGIVWRPRVTVGSTVGHGNEMMTLIDCSTLFVTASFSAKKFDDLRPGAQAMVRVSDSGAEYTATVVDVRAVRGSDAGDFAAPLPQLGAHQVMALLRIDNPGAMTGEKYCNVGRHVEIRFKDFNVANAAPAATTKLAAK
jgi:multidrug resistance efflux pump